MKKFTQLQKHGAAPMKRAAALALVLMLAFALCMPAAAASVGGIIGNAKNAAGEAGAGVIFLGVLAATIGLCAKRNWLPAIITFLAGGLFSALVARPDVFTSLGTNILNVLVG